MLFRTNILSSRIAHRAIQPALINRVLARTAMTQSVGAKEKLSMLGPYEHFCTRKEDREAFHSLASKLDIQLSGDEVADMFDAIYQVKLSEQWKQQGKKICFEEWKRHIPIDVLHAVLEQGKFSEL